MLKRILFSQARKSRHLLLVIFGALASGCGGGGGGGSEQGQPPVPAPITSFQCDASTSAAAAPHTAPYINQLESVDSSVSKLTFERWPLEVDGQPNELNMAISRPPELTPVRGLVLVVHGFSSANATLAPIAMVDQYWNAQMNSRGYLSVNVALRGNFGSTGARLVDLEALGLLAQYYAKQIPYADLELAATRYQSASVVAVLKKMASDPAYQPYMSTLFLIGSSGGANTVLQTAADSPVFKAAAKRALVRLDGLDSAFDTNPDALPGVSQYSARIAKDTSSSMWIGGLEDPITSIGQLACQFKFYDQAAGFPNFFYVVPGLGHAGPSALFSPTLLPLFKQYMVSRQFAGF